MSPVCHRQWDRCLWRWWIMGWILETNCTDKPSPFIAQRPSTYSKRNMEKFLWRLDLGWGKVVCCMEHKSGNISETRGVREKLLWRAYWNLPTLFRTVPSLTPTACCSSQVWGFATPPKTKIAIILNGWSYELQIWAGTFTGPSEQKPIKNFW